MRRAWRSLRLVAEWWILAVVSTLLGLAIVYDGTTARLDRLTYDLMLRADESSPDPRILLVTIDDASLEQFGPWPWPRDLQARLVAALADAEPAGAAYDVLLLEPTTPAADAALAKAVSSTRIFLPLLISAPGRNGAPFETIVPMEPVRRAATGIGHVSLIADVDGMFRRIRLVEGSVQAPIPHLMLALAGTARAPSDSATPKLLPFAGGSGTFPSISASAALRGEIPRELLAGRLLVVGATAAGLGDRHPTARGDGEGVMTGLEIQANILDAVLRGRLISNGSLAEAGLLTIVPLWMLLLGLRVAPARQVPWVVAGAGVLVAGTSALLLLQLRVWISPVPALVLLILVYPLWAWRRLAAVSGHMLRRLEDLRQEPDLLGRARPAPGGADPITRQLLLLDDAITGLRDMRKFVGESLHQIPDAILILSREGQLLLANGAGAALLESFGLSKTASDLMELLGALDPIEEETGAPLDRGGLPRPPDIQPWQGWLLSRDQRVFEGRLTERQGDQDTPLGWILRLSEVTELWQGRQQREELMQFLSHDMRTPQASILAAIDGAGPGQVAASVADRVRTYARRTLKLADDFVQLARAERMTYRLEPLDLSDILAVAADEIWPRLAEKRVELVLEGHDREWLVEGERSLLTRALLNLFDNAAKFSPHDSVVRCRLSAEGDREVHVEISDSGPGMAADQICALFERYRIGDRSDGSGKGTGLGLTFVNVVVRRHAGSISCKSSLGRGTIFRVSLPLVA